MAFADVSSSVSIPAQQQSTNQPQNNDPKQSSTSGGERDNDHLNDDLGKPLQADENQKTDQSESYSEDNFDTTQQTGTSETDAPTASTLSSDKGNDDTKAAGAGARKGFDNQGGNLFSEKNSTQGGAHGKTAGMTDDTSSQEGNVSGLKAKSNDDTKAAGAGARKGFDNESGHLFSKDGQTLGKAHAGLETMHGDTHSLGQAKREDGHLFAKAAHDFQGGGDKIGKMASSLKEARTSGLDTGSATSGDLDPENTDPTSQPEPTVSTKTASQGTTIISNSDASPDDVSANIVGMQTALADIDEKGSGKTAKASHQKEPSIKGDASGDSISNHGVQAKTNLNSTLKSQESQKENPSLQDQNAKSTAKESLQSNINSDISDDSNELQSSVQQKVSSTQDNIQSDITSTKEEVHSDIASGIQSGVQSHIQDLEGRVSNLEKLYQSGMFQEAAFDVQSYEESLNQPTSTAPPLPEPPSPDSAAFEVGYTSMLSANNAAASSIAESDSETDVQETLDNNTEINIQNQINAQQNSHKKSGPLAVLQQAAPYVEIAVGVVLLAVPGTEVIGGMMIAMGVTQAICDSQGKSTPLSMLTSRMTTAIIESLVKDGCPDAKIIAEIMTAFIIVGVMIAMGVGVSALMDGGEGAAAVGGETALDEGAVGADTATSDAAATGDTEVAASIPSEDEEGIEMTTLASTRSLSESSEEMEESSEASSTATKASIDAASIPSEDAGDIEMTTFSSTRSLSETSEEMEESSEASSAVSAETSTTSSSIKESVSAASKRISEARENFASYVSSFSKTFSLGVGKFSVNMTLNPMVLLSLTQTGMGIAEGALSLQVAEYQVQIAQAQANIEIDQAEFKMEEEYITAGESITKSLLNASQTFETNAVNIISANNQSVGNVDTTARAIAS